MSDKTAIKAGDNPAEVPSSEARTRTHVLDEVPEPGTVRLLAIWPGGSQSLSLPELPASIRVGRAQSSDLRIDDESVSRSHVSVHCGAPDADGERRIMVEDLGGANGTRLNGRRIPSASSCLLRPGDVVELGGAVVLLQRGDATHGASPGGAPASTPPAAASPTLPPPSLRRPSTHAPAVVLVSAAMKRLFRTVDLVAPSRINVLVFGETGVGKELVARALHARSPRAHGPYVPLNCASMPESLLESELFGFEKGAFTGAERAKPGLFEVAHGGTLLLDEVGEMPLATQAKLLRVLEQREVWRVGATSGRPVDVRVVAATHRSLEHMTREGRFRADLYFRLNGLRLEIPPLRERNDDIAALAQSFVAAAAAEQGIPPPALEPLALRALEAHGWPGNVRQLRNAIERAVALSQGQPIGVAQLALEAQPFSEPSAAPSAEGARPMALEEALSDLERERIVNALEQTAGNQSRAAELLGMPRRTLVKRLGEYQLPRPRKPKAE